MFYLLSHKLIFFYSKFIIFRDYCFSGYLRRFVIICTNGSIIYIYIYNKSTMLENAEKYFNGPPGIRTHDLGNTA